MSIPSSSFSPERTPNRDVCRRSACCPRATRSLPRRPCRSSPTCLKMARASGPSRTASTRTTSRLTASRSRTSGPVGGRRCTSWCAPPRSLRSQVVSSGLTRQFADPPHQWPTRRVRGLPLPDRRPPCPSLCSPPAPLRRPLRQDPRAAHPHCGPSAQRRPSRRAPPRQARPRPLHVALERGRGRPLDGRGGRLARQGRAWARPGGREWREGRVWRGGARWWAAAGRAGRRARGRRDGDADARGACLSLFASSSMCDSFAHAAWACTRVSSSHAFPPP